MPAEKTFLLTGATGFLARHVLEQMGQHVPGQQAIPLVRDLSAWQNRDWGAEAPCLPGVVGGVTDLSGWAESLPALDGIFHLAALVRHSRKDPEDLYETNIQGSLNMVKLAAAKKCRLVFISTSGTVGVFDSRHEWADEHSPYLEQKVARWPYYDSKIKAERATRKLAAELGVEMVIIRPPVLMGPGDHRFRSTSHVIRYMRRRLPFLIQGGMHFVDIRDAAAAIIQAMLHPEPQPVYHLSGVACSIETFFRMVEVASGVAPPPVNLPHALAQALAKTASGLAGLIPGMHESPLPDPVVVEMAGKYWDVRSRYATRDLGFINRHGQDTLNDTVAWLLAHHPKLRTEFEALEGPAPKLAEGH